MQENPASSYLKLFQESFLYKQKIKELLEPPGSSRISPEYNRIFVECARFEMKCLEGALKSLLDSKAGFDPSQPRVPAGNPDGGEWTDAGGGGGGGSPRLGTGTPSSIRDNPLFTPTSYSVPASRNSPPPVPKYENGIRPVSEEDWHAIHEVLDNRPGASDTEILAYSNIFAAEGGFMKDPTGSAVAGIPQNTLDWAKSEPGLADKLKNVHTPGDLRNHPELVPDIYKAYFDDSLRTVGGSAALEKVGNDYAAAALADTLFREGKYGGAQIIKDAVNNVLRQESMPEIVVALKPEETLVVGPKIMEGYSNLAKDQVTLGPLLDNVAKARRAYRPKETARPDYFRFEKDRAQGRGI